MLLRGRVTEIRTSPPANEMAEIDVVVQGGGEAQKITIRATHGRSLWDMLKDQGMVEVLIGPAPLMTTNRLHKGDYE